MKKLFVLLWLVGCSVCAVFAQTDNGRDLSKYADDKFGDDDKYEVETPYQTVVVKQPKSKKIKNVIFMIGDGMSMEAVTVGWTLNGRDRGLDPQRRAPEPGQLPGGRLFPHLLHGPAHHRFLRRRHRPFLRREDQIRLHRPGRERETLLHPAPSGAVPGQEDRPRRDVPHQRRHARRLRVPQPGPPTSQTSTTASSSACSRRWTWTRAWTAVPCWRTAR